MTDTPDIITPTETNSVWEERYSDLDVQIVTDLSALSPQQLATLHERVEGAIERGCTVGHTLDKGAAIRLHLLGDED